ncbi:MAG: hypothetical protein ACXWE7_13045, partial [Nitrososphaeraceae archaeon]
GDAVVNHPAQLIETTKNNKLFFSLKHDGGGQGLYDYEGEYLLSFYKNNWKLFGSFITNVYHFNSSNIETYNWKYTGKLSVINGQKEYPEFLLTKKGTEEDSKGNIIPAKNTIYVFNGKEYIEKQ